jgi:Ca2+-transporting ATPase
VDIEVGAFDAAERESADGPAPVPTPPSPVVPIHALVPGRARLRVAGLKHGDAVKAALESALSRAVGIDRVAASTWTGNLLVHYERSIPLGRIVAAVEAALATPPAAGEGDAASIAGGVRPEAAAGASAERPWHVLTGEEVAALTDSSTARGLASTAVRERLARAGANTLPRPPQRSQLAILVEQLESLPNALLAASSVLSLLTGGVADAVITLGVVAINAAVGYATESEAERTIGSLMRSTANGATVLRDGKISTVPIEEVVVGDVQVLEPGSFVAADARVVAARDLSVDESLLTGESLPVTKTAAPLARTDVPLAERRNMVYRGTALTGGGGLAIVVATGPATEIGRIQALVGTATPPATPMQRQLQEMGRRLAWLSGGICAVVGVLGLLRGQGLLPVLKTATSLAVAAVPEGLPAIATTTLALGIRDIRRHHVLVRHLGAVEALGAVQTVCLDKTGTLTLNRMSVVAIHCAGDEVRLADGTFTVNGGQVSEAMRDHLARLLEVAALCNETEIDEKVGRRAVNGSPTEAALVLAALDLGVDVASLRRRFPLLATDYRSERQNWMTTVHATADGGRLVAVKGNPGEVLSRCRWYLTGCRFGELTDEIRQSIEVANERMGGEALRVLGVAEERLDADGGGGRGLVWLGLVGMADPPRPGMGELVEVFHRAGIATVMITGDQSATAYAVARRLGLSNGGRTEILDSTHLENLPPKVLSTLAQRAHVFSRVSPSHKLQIVQALQRAGVVVAMTGDGINDSPALKAADIGIAMGCGGTQVARDVADVVLQNDDPRTVATAIEKGRTIYNNVRKSLRFLLATNLSEILVMLGGNAGGLGQTLTPLQLLWINLMTDVFPALALAVEPPETEVMREPPRPAAEAILRRGDFRHVVVEGATIAASALAAGTYARLRYGPGPRTSTITFLSLITGQLLHALSCRSDRQGMFSGRPLAANRWLRLALGGSFAVQLTAAVVPGTRRLLGLVPIGFADGVVTVAAGIAPFVINELAKTAAKTAAPPSPAGPAGREAGREAGRGAGRGAGREEGRPER